MILASAFALAAAALSLPAQAQLLGSGGLVDIGSGAPSGDATISVGLGGDGNVAGVSVGGSGGSEAVSIGVGNSGGGAGVSAGVLGNSASVGVGSNGLSVGLGAGGQNAAGPGAISGAGRNGTGSVSRGNGGGSAASAIATRIASNSASCKTTNVKQIAQLVRSTKFESWKRIANVQLQRVPMCREIAKRVRSELNASTLGRKLQAAVQSDALVRESLSRTRYGADDVLAVRKSGGNLVIYVY